LNSEYEIFASKKNKFDIEINELKAEHISILNSISYSNEQINEAERSIASISGEKGYLEKTIYNPEQIILTEEGSDENKTYKTSFNLENIDEESIVIYLKYSGGQAS
jgi:hypothetical protein